MIANHKRTHKSNKSSFEMPFQMWCNFLHSCCSTVFFSSIWLDIRYTIIILKFVFEYVLKKKKTEIHWLLLITLFHMLFIWEIYGIFHLLTMYHFFGWYLLVCLFRCYSLTRKPKRYHHYFVKRFCIRF